MRVRGSVSYTHLDVYKRQGRLDAAVVALRGAVEREPDYFLARFHLAGTLQQLQREHEALPEYFRALRSAQQRGEWLNDCLLYTSRCV